MFDFPAPRQLILHKCSKTVNLILRRNKYKLELLLLPPLLSYIYIDPIRPLEEKLFWTLAEHFGNAYPYMWTTSLILQYCKAQIKRIIMSRMYIHFFTSWYKCRFDKWKSFYLCQYHVVGKIHFNFWGYDQYRIEYLFIYIASFTIL